MPFGGNADTDGKARYAVSSASLFNDQQISAAAVQPRSAWLETLGMTRIRVVITQTGGPLPLAGTGWSLEAAVRGGDAAGVVTVPASVAIGALNTPFTEVFEAIAAYRVRVIADITDPAHTYTVSLMCSS